MSPMFRHLSLLTAALLLLISPLEAQAKRYLLKRDPKTGRVKVVDPNESTLSKITKPILRPVTRPLVRTKTVLFGRKVQARGQIKGFGGPIDQRGMQEPTGFKPRVTAAASSTVTAAGSVAGTVAGGQAGREAAGFFTRALRKTFGLNPPPNSSANRSSQGGR